MVSFYPKGKTNTINIFLLMYEFLFLYLNKVNFSVGILRYMCREFNTPDHWYPKESKAQAKVDEYLEWQHMNTRMHLLSYTRTKVRNKIKLFLKIHFLFL